MSTLEWGLAKKIVLFFLIVINISLGIINYEQIQHYNISPLQEKNIEQLLLNNGIMLKSKLDIHHKPMARLVSEVFLYDKHTIDSLFFKNHLSILSQEYHGNDIQNVSIYENELSRLTLNGTTGIFEHKSADWTTIHTDEVQAVQVAIQEIRNFETVFGTFIQTQSYYTPEGWVVEFVATEDDYLIYSNIFKVYISDAGLYKIEFNYSQILAYNSELRDIISVDEALLSFIRHLSNDSLESDSIYVSASNHDNDEDITNTTTVNGSIERIELGYYVLEQKQLLSKTRFYMEPCYIIYMLNDHTSYIIDAYTGSVIAV